MVLTLPNIVRRLKSSKPRRCESEHNNGATAHVVSPDSNSTQEAFDSVWLSRYPRPMQAGFDNGSEFKWLFQELIKNFGLKAKPTTDHNPQANATGLGHLHAQIMSANHV